MRLFSKRAFKKIEKACQKAFKEIYCGEDTDWCEIESITIYTEFIKVTINYGREDSEKPELNFHEEYSFDIPENFNLKTLEGQVYQHIVDSLFL